MSNLPQRPRIGNQRPTPGNQRPDVRRLPNSRRQQGSPETRPVPGKRKYLLAVIFLNVPLQRSPLSPRNQFAQM